MRFRFDISRRLSGLSDLCQFCYSERVLGCAVSVISGLAGVRTETGRRYGESVASGCVAGFPQVGRLEGIQTSAFLLVKNISFLHKLIFLNLLSLKANGHSSAKYKIRFRTAAHLCCP